MVNRIRKRLKQEMALYFVLVTCIVLSIVGAISGYHIFNSQQQLVLVTQQQVAQRVSEEVQHLLTQSARHLDLLILTSDFERQPLAIQSESLFEFFYWKKTHDFIALYSVEKEPLYYTHRTYSYSQTQTDNPLIEVALNDVIRTKAPYFGDVIYNQTTGEPGVIMAMPVMDVVSGELVNIIVVSLRFKAIWDIMAREARQHQFSVFLVSDDQRIVAHQDPSVVIVQRRFSLDDMGYLSRGVDGRRAIIGKAALPLGNKTYWVYSEQSIHVAFAQAWGSVLWMISGVFAAFLVAISLGIFFSRRITQPLDELMAGVHSVISGNLSHQIQVSGNNELFSLAKHFNEMTIQLNQLVGDLHKKNQSCRVTQSL